MPTCPNCGSQQPDGAAFCDECGAALGGVAPAVSMPAAAPVQPAPAPPAAAGTVCPACGASTMPGEAFCENCGASLSQAVGAPVPTPVPSAVPPSPAMPAPTPAAAPVAGPLTCSNCGAQLEPGSAFCDMCGTPVGAPAAPAQYPPPTAVPPYTPPPVTPYPPVAPPPYAPVGVLQGRLVVQGTNAALSFPPGKAEIIIGREDPVSGVFPEVDLTDHGGDEGGVSRRHARIFMQGAQVFIEDLNSTNYTYVNQQKLMPGQPHPLNNGDEVRVGRVKLNFYAA